MHTHGPCLGLTYASLAPWRRSETDEPVLFDPDTPKRSPARQAAPIDRSKMSTATSRHRSLPGLIGSVTPSRTRQSASVVHHIIGHTHIIAYHRYRTSQGWQAMADDAGNTMPPSYEALAEENRRLRAELAALRGGGGANGSGSSHSHHQESPSAPLPPLPPVERLSAAQVRSRRHRCRPIDSARHNHRRESDPFSHVTNLTRQNCPRSGLALLAAAARAGAGRGGAEAAAGVVRARGRGR